MPTLTLCCLRCVARWVSCASHTCTHVQVLATPVCDILVSAGAVLRSGGNVLSPCYPGVWHTYTTCYNCIFAIVYNNCIFAIVYNNCTACHLLKLAWFAVTPPYRVLCMTWLSVWLASLTARDWAMCLCIMCPLWQRVHWHMQTFMQNGKFSRLHELIYLCTSDCRWMLSELLFVMICRLCSSKQARTYLPEPPFLHEDFIKNGRLKIFSNVDSSEYWLSSVVKQLTDHAWQIRTDVAFPFCPPLKLGTCSF